MDKKYYWFLTLYENTYTEWLTEGHPIQRQDKDGVLLNWREITEEDYNLFKKMENE